jgi:hypothetical protein
VNGAIAVAGVQRESSDRQSHGAPVHNFNALENIFAPPLEYGESNTVSAPLRVGRVANSSREARLVLILFAIEKNESRRPQFALRACRRRFKSD